jgi:hypothetical protein
MQILTQIAERNLAMWRTMSGLNSGNAEKRPEWKSHEPLGNDRDDDDLNDRRDGLHDSWKND